MKKQSLSKKESGDLARALNPGASASLNKMELLSNLTSLGVLPDDPRFRRLQSFLKQAKAGAGLQNEALNYLDPQGKAFLEKAGQSKLIIPDFVDFCSDLSKIYNNTLGNTAGKLADYIPQLSRINPEQYGVSVCTIDGQRFSIGDSSVPFCVQSSCKPVNYSLALNEHGEEYIHRYVGHEPSGKSFNELTLNDQGLPHNPMINSGAIMCCSLIRQDLSMADRFDHIISTWRKLSGGQTIGFNNSVYQSEKQTADRNFALGYFMREKKAFPQNTDLLQVLEFYFQCCAIEVTTSSMAVVASTFANGGFCPLTNEKVLAPEPVKSCLSLMESCGMYDFSGEFAYSIGLPAKSGVSGVIMIVIPNVMGICVWSPRLDKPGNSVRGIDFSRQLVSKFNFHKYDSLVPGQCQKKDPRLLNNKQNVPTKGVPLA